MSCALPAGSGKTLAFLLPIIAVLHQQRQQQQQQPQHAAGSSAANGKPALSSAKQNVRTAQSGNKRLRGQVPSAEAAEGNVNTAGGTETTAKGNPESSSGAGKGPGAVILAPSRELAAQTVRCLLLLLKGTKLRCTLLTAAVAAGTDFSKVQCCSFFQTVCDTHVAHARCCCNA